MVISATDTKLDIFNKDYVQFLELFNTPAFQDFTNRTQQKVVVFDLASREYCFVSNMILQEGKSSLPAERQLFTVWSCMNEASLTMLETELLPMMINVSKRYPQELSKLYFEATVQLNDMRWCVLLSHLLCLNKDHSSVLVSSILTETPTAPKPVGLQCSAFKIDGKRTDLIINLRDENNHGHALGLSKREQEVLRLLCKGKTSKIISEQLFVSFETVKKHRQNILEKTGCKNTVELMNLAMSMGII